MELEQCGKCRSVQNLYKEEQSVGEGRGKAMVQKAGGVLVVMGGRGRRWGGGGGRRLDWG